MFFEVYLYKIMCCLDRIILYQIGLQQKFA